MKTSTLKEKLENLTILFNRIEEVARPVYEEYNKAVVELIPEFVSRSKEEIQGILVAPITLAFKDGKSWTLRPTYVKDGNLTNTSFKALGINAFTITEKGVKEYK